VYGSSSEEVAEDVRDGELAQLRYYSKLSGHAGIAVVADMYGEDEEWEYGDQTGAITRKRTPATEFWPNVHFDPGRYDISKREHFVKTFPGKFDHIYFYPATLLTETVERMPLKFIDNEAIIATQANRERRAEWMLSLDGGTSLGDREGRLVTEWKGIRKGRLPLVVPRMKIETSNRCYEEGEEETRTEAGEGQKTVRGEGQN
jgi:hypothetical protein